MLGSPSDALLRLVERDGGVCHICKTPVDLTVTAHHPASPSRDHVIPRCLVPKGTKGDHKLAHAFCNSIRGHRSIGKCKPHDFKQRLAKAVRQYEERKARKLLVDGKYSVG
jgi:hypothetical protein